MKDDKVDEGMKTMFVGHILIRDAETGKVLLNKRDIDALKKPQDNQERSDGHR
jgi:hypothetical protein